MRTVKIKDLGTVVTGSTPPTANAAFYGSKYLFIKPSDLSIGQRRVLSTETTLSQEGGQYLGSKLLPRNSTCIVCIGTIGKLGLTSEPCFTNQQLNSVIVDKSSYDSLYVYYLLSTTIPQLQKIQGGSASGRHHANKTNFEGIEVRVHRLADQKRIAAILSAYDDLIENNNRRIKILEQMARLIYREWFVHFRFPGHEKVRMVETTYTPAEFLTTLADHIPDRYRHNIRYFGLLAPRVKGRTHDAVFALLGQERLGKPRPLRWAASMKKSFGVDPLLDREGQRMRWARRIPPTPASAQVPQGAGPVAR